MSGAPRGAGSGGEGRAAAPRPAPAEPVALAVDPEQAILGPSFAWLLPLAALALAAVFGWQALRGQGLVVTVRAQEGHGIRPGDALRYRGITAGEVRAVRLSADAREVVLTVALDPAAAELARAGSRFWIVRPHVSLEGVTGLETLIGARYLTVLPGPPEGPFQTEFVALDEPPVTSGVEPDGLEVRLAGDARHGVRRGAPLTYRGVEIGSVLAVALAGDATSVEVRVHVRPAYAALVREDSRFFQVSGLDVSLGLTGGLTVELESARALLVGGIALATPTRPGEPASPGQLFQLHAAPEKEWLAWRPPIPVGGELGIPGAALPRPARALRAFRQGRLVARPREVSGLVLRLADGWVGPADLLAPADPGRERDPSLSVAGRPVPPDAPLLARGGGVARIAWEGAGEPGDPAAAPEPGLRRRALGEPEASLVVGEPGAQPLALDPARLRAEGGHWRIERAVAPGRAWHGAPVVARADGALLGLLLVEGRDAHVAPIP